MKTLSGPEFEAWFTKHSNSKGSSLEGAAYMALSKEDKVKARERMLQYATIRKRAPIMAKMMKFEKELEEQIHKGLNDSDVKKYFDQHIAPLIEEMGQDPKVNSGLTKVVLDKIHRAQQAYKESLPKESAPAAAAAEPGGKMPINPKILALKVGDYIHYSVGGGYMGDGGDSRDSAGYSVSFKITKIEGEKYHVTGGRYGHDSSFIVAIKKPSMGGSPSSWGNSLHLVSGKAYGDRKDFIPNNYTMKDESFGENEYNYAKARELGSKKESAKAAKKAADWTRSTKYELVSMIDKHFEAEGKQMRGHKTAGKDKLIEIIRKYKIAE